MKQYGILLDNGKVVEDPGWSCPADVISSFHGFGVKRVYGTLVAREDASADWAEVLPVDQAVKS